MPRLRLIIISLFLAHSASAGPLDQCAEHLPFGIPTLAASVQTTALCHVGFAALHDDDLLVPRWVAYHLTGQHSLGCVKRTNNFHSDPNLDPNHRATPSDYLQSGYDKGHQAPAQDFAWNIDRMKDSFSMANMAPQLPGLNRQQWLRLEESVRAWATDRQELIIYVGPVLLNPKETISKHHIVVPTAFWKVVVDPLTHASLAFLMPQQNIVKSKLDPWQVPIDEIEQTTGITLPLPRDADIHVVPSLWKVNIAAWNRKHKLNCGG